jgi:hypothetical protein
MSTHLNEHPNGIETQQAGQADDPAHPEDRRAFDDAHIRMRGDGRQLVIDTGQEPEADGLDVHPDREAEVEDEADTEAPTVESIIGVVRPIAGDGAPSLTPSGHEQIMHGFSGCARRRLRKRLHSMERGADGLFLTLTYHEADPTPEECKADLDRFWKRLDRRFPGISAIWKMEPQDRGVPHFHLLVYGQSFIPAPLLSSIWHEVTAETTDEHRKSGVDVESRSVNENGKLQGYMAGYMAETYDKWPGAEPGDPWAETGRWWGCLGRESLPWAGWDEAKIHLDQHEAQAIIRQLLTEWEVDLPDRVVPPSLCICTRGDPQDWIDEHLPV